MRVKAYTDGACSGNPGPGGWGVYLVAENNVGEIAVSYTHLTLPTIYSV